MKVEAAVVKPMEPVGGRDDADPLLRLVADSVPALMAYYELPTLQCRFANRRYAEYNGWTTQTLLGKTVHEAVGEAAWQVIELHVHAVMAGQQVQYQRAQRMPSGQQRMIDVSLIPHFAASGAQIGAFVLIHDITEAWQAEQAVRDSETRMRKFVEATQEGIFFHKNGVITDINGALLRLTGYALPEVLGHQMIEFVAPPWQQAVLDNFRAGNEAPFEATILHKDGHEIQVEMVGKTMPFEGESYRLVAVRDITAQKQAQARIKFMALHDPLTQLPNRIYLGEHLDNSLALARRQKKSIALLFIDLDHFKEVNDLLGHHAGDALLRDVAARLKAVVRQSDFVARLGGDEFLVVLTDIADVRDVIRVADTLVASIDFPVAVPGRTVRVSPSIGISQFPEHGDSADALIRYADTAMYQAKARGGRAYQRYAPEAGPAS
jgi:diguanylate cyclase (GGDEF)-like protein/PAS domain S-box-containing protein